MIVDHFYTLDLAVGQKEGGFVQIVKSCITADGRAGLMFRNFCEIHSHLFICRLIMLTLIIFCPAQLLYYEVLFL